MQGLRAAAQDGSITAFDAQPGCVDRHVRTGFVNDADDTQGDAHLSDLNAAGPEFEIRDFTNRIRQRNDLQQSLRHAANRRPGQAEAIQQ